MLEKIKSILNTVFFATTNKDIYIEDAMSLIKPIWDKEIYKARNDIWTDVSLYIAKNRLLKEKDYMNFCQFGNECLGREASKDGLRKYEELHR